MIPVPVEPTIEPLIKIGVSSQRVERLKRSARVKMDADRLARVQMAEENIFFFARYYFPGHFPFEIPKFHWDMMDDAMAVAEPWRTGVKRLFIAAPRGHSKSTVMSFLLPLWWICFKRKEMVVIVSQTASQSIKLVMDIKRELEDNERLRADFGDLCGDTIPRRPLKWTESEIIAAHRDEQGRPVFRTKILALSTGKQVRGIKDGKNRPDAIICDDLEHEKFVATKEQREKIWNWYTGSLIPMLNMDRGSVIVIGTILHFDSLLNRLLKIAEYQKKENNIAFRSRLYRAIEPDGSILWEQKFSRATLEGLKFELKQKFNTEFLNNPLDEDARLFRPEWFRERWYYKNEIAYDQGNKCWTWRGQSLEIFVGVDPAIGEKDTNDYFALTVLGVAQKTKDIIVLFTLATRMDFPKQVQEIIGIAARWQPRMIGIEKNAYQDALPQQLMREAAALPIKRLSNTTQKFQRIQRSTVFFENQQVWMRAAADGEIGDFDVFGDVRVHSLMRPLYDQMMEYPSGANDDVLDSLENALQIARDMPKAFDASMLKKLTQSR